MKILAILVLMVASSLAGESPLRIALLEFAAGNHQFTGDIYKELVKINPGNILVSPFSAETVLTLTAQGALGATRQELRSGLHLPAPNKTDAALFYLLKSLNKDDNGFFTANKIYVANNFKLNKDLKRSAVENFKADLQNLDFGRSVESANTINEWVESKTNHRIQNLIAPDELNSDVKAVLVNTLYFSGIWATEFEKYRTAREVFYRSERETSMVEMMHVTDTFSFYADDRLDCQFLELPYLGGEVAMTIVLPNRKDGLAALEKNIVEVFKTPKYFNERVDVSLPKFAIETSINFVPILKTLGIRKVFDPAQADLRGIGQGGENLFIGNVVQKAYINVTETGTEAAAATAGTIVATSVIIHPNPPIPFKVDRPFIYMIKFKQLKMQTSIIAFAGKVTSPKS